MDALATFTQTISRIDLRAAVDLFIVTLGVYWLLTLISGTTAATLVRGILVLFVFGFLLSNAFQLTVLGWLLRNSIPALLVAVPILFAPELRRALEQVGRAGSLIPRSPVASASNHVADVVATAARQLAERRWGGLIVIERDTPLGEYASSGVEIDGRISVDLLLNVFYPNSPLHDGAVIVRGERLLAAGVVLPLSEAVTMGHMGTRHRAAIGITERTNAISVVVSEETGALSIANAGRMVRNLGEPRLRKVLAILLEHAPPGGPPGSRRRPWSTRKAADGTV
jgi:uncharacterized protein (TIGR00159 family)